MKRKVALWKWLLLFVAAMVLSIIGYGLLMALAELGGIALMNVIGAIVLLLLYALAVRLLERHWPADAPLACPFVLGPADRCSVYDSGRCADMGRRLLFYRACCHVVARTVGCRLLVLVCGRRGGNHVSRCPVPLD